MSDERPALSDQIPVYRTTPAIPTPRYTVRRDMPAEMLVHFRAWVHDAKHRDDPHAGAPCCWCENLADALRIEEALNRDELFRARLRNLIVDEALDRPVGFV